MKRLLFIIGFLLSTSVMAVEWSGVVVGISDGDTLTVLNQQKIPVKIRLVEIDAPEKNQDFGNQSKQSLSDICFKKMAVVDDRGVDRYKRTLGRVYCEKIDANAEQVKRGLAWAYRQYLSDPAISDLEASAKAQKIGLWLGATPMPPWEFRHGAKKSVESVGDDTKETYHIGPRAAVIR